MYLDELRPRYFFIKKKPLGFQPQAAYAEPEGYPSGLKNIFTEKEIDGEESSLVVEFGVGNFLGGGKNFIGAFKGRRCLEGGDCLLENQSPSRKHFSYLGEVDIGRRSSVNGVETVFSDARQNVIGNFQLKDFSRRVIGFHCEQIENVFGNEIAFPHAVGKIIFRQILVNPCPANDFVSFSAGSGRNFFLIVDIAEPASDR